MGRPKVLLPLDPIGLSREEAAAFIAVSPAFFSQLVELGVMPKPKAVGSRRIWDRKSIERAWQRLPEIGEEMSEPVDQWSDVQT